MEHKVTYKNPDGTLQEVVFDDFEQFADSIDNVAQQYYSGVMGKAGSTVLDKVESIHKDGFTVIEKVTDEQPREGAQFLKEWTSSN